MVATRGVRMTVAFRAATMEDAAALDRIFRTSFCDTFAHLYSAEDFAAFLSSFGLADWQAELADPDYAFRIAEDDGNPVAFIKLGPLKLPMETARPAIMLHQLYVLSEYHGAGLARPLMDWALAEASRRSAEEMYLTVFVDNHRARKFYDRYGFEVAGRYDFMVGNHADEDVIMRKAL